MPLYHAQRRSPAKSVMHHAIIDTDNRLGLLRSRDVFGRPAVVADLNSSGPNVVVIQDVSDWALVQEITDEAGAPARLPVALTRWPYDPLANNCEHFANEVAPGERKSPQLRGGVAVAFLAILGFVLGSDK